MMAIEMNFIDKSRSVRGIALAMALLLPPNSLPAKPTALLITLHDFTMPITPAIAIAPMPIKRA